MAKISYLFKFFILHLVRKPLGEDGVKKKT